MSRGLLMVISLAAGAMTVCVWQLVNRFRARRAHLAVAPGSMAVPAMTGNPATYRVGASINGISIFWPLATLSFDDQAMHLGGLQAHPIHIARAEVIELERIASRAHVGPWALGCPRSGRRLAGADRQGLDDLAALLVDPAGHVDCVVTEPLVEAGYQSHLDGYGYG